MSRRAARAVLILLAAGILVGGCFINDGSFWSSWTAYFLVFWTGCWVGFGVFRGIAALLAIAGWLEVP